MRKSKEMRGAIVAAKRGSVVLKKYFGRATFDLKMDNSFVCQADRNSQKVIYKILGKRFPDYGLIGEEGNGNRGNSEYAWVVDPLDGTTNYKNGLTLCCVSIALMKGKRPMLGVVYNPFSEELFCAEDGQGCFLNDEPVRVSDTNKLKLATLSFSHGGSAHWTNKYLTLYVNLKRSFRHSRQLGATALELAYVACGRFDGYVIPGLKLWDVAAGTVLVREAGGSVTEFSGKEFNSHSKTLFASNGKVHDKVISLVNSNKGSV